MAIGINTGKRLRTLLIAPAETAKTEPNWVKVKLVFCRGVNPDKKKAGKHDWALFLSTDASLSDEKILEIYALR